MHMPKIFVKEIIHPIITALIVEILEYCLAWSAFKHDAAS